MLENIGTKSFGDESSSKEPNLKYLEGGFSLIQGYRS
jgi:hypothetical protein